MSEELTGLNNETTANASTSAANDSWLSSLPEELKGAESLAKFKDVSSLAQSYLEAEKSLTSRVAIPKPEASDEEWSKFYQKLGLPEDKKYTDKRSPEDEEYLSKYEEMFHQSGLTKRQGSKLFEHLYNFSTDLQKQQIERVEQSRKDNVDWLKSSYGSEFENKMTVMQAALSRFGTKELASMLEESSYSPPLVDLLVKVGEVLKSDSLVTGSQVPTITSAEAALKEIKRLESSSEFMVKYKDKRHNGHEEAVKQLNDLYAVAYKN